MQTRRQHIPVLPRAHLFMLVGVLSISLVACDSNSNAVDVPTDPGECNIPTNQFADGGVGKDGIPALTNPQLTEAENATYLADNDRVIGLNIKGRAVAVPHNILWRHEIANFTFLDDRLVVTYCPLTGSSMAFDRASIGGGEFGVSGLLFQNNLTMYDRTNQESLWPQMNREAGCGPRVGARLEMIPVIEMTWGGWKALHPGTEVVSGNTGLGANYTSTGYPYGNYEEPNNGSLLFPMTLDDRRPPKERVLGIANGAAGIAFPFGVLDSEGPVQAIHETVGGEPVVVFWDRGARGAMAFRPAADGDALTFVVQGDQLMDEQTQSVWQLDGRAIAGPLAGSQLEPLAEAYVAFWFAWAAFQPNTRLWEGS